MLLSYCMLKWTCQNSFVSSIHIQEKELLPWEQLKQSTNVKLAEQVWLILFKGDNGEGYNSQAIQHRSSAYPTGTDND